MAETGPRKPLIIKLYLPRSEKRGPPSEATIDSRSHKRRKVVSSNSSKTQCDIQYSSYAAVGGTKSETQRSIVKENSKTNTKDSRIVSEYNVDSHGKKMMKVTTKVSVVAKSRTRTPCNTEHPEKAKSFALGKAEIQFNVVKENSRADSRTKTKECTIEKKGLKCKKEKKSRENNMDRYRKMQCWVILKRLMIGRDGWALKQPLDAKVLRILDNSKKILSESKLNSEKILKPIGLEDIESKLKKWMYSRPDEFADDIRLVFSHALLYPSRSEIHRIARRLSENFELSWKSLREKWTREERKGKKICKREVCAEADREVHEKKTQKKSKDSGGDLRDSQYFCDAKSISLSRSNTNSCPTFQCQTQSTDCMLLKKHNISITDSQLSPPKGSKGSIFGREQRA